MDIRINLQFMRRNVPKKGVLKHSNYPCTWVLGITYNFLKIVCSDLAESDNSHSKLDIEKPQLVKYFDIRSLRLIDQVEAYTSNAITCSSLMIEHSSDEVGPFGEEVLLSNHGKNCIKRVKT